MIDDDADILLPGVEHKDKNHEDFTINYVSIAGIERNQGISRPSHLLVL